MITKMSHTSLFVLDQEKAYDFYVNKLGLKVNTDVWMGADTDEEGEAPKAKQRWLTLNAPDQPDLEIILMPINKFSPDTEQAIRLLLEKGMLGAGVFTTTDCRASYVELKAKGVVFKSEPKEQFYGVECIMTDSCGNWFSLTQPSGA